MTIPNLSTPFSAPRHVILCDETGRPQGTADLVAAHSGHGQLHLAFSVYIFRPDRQSLLIQQRSAGKKLWPLIWANTCCSHLREGETLLDAGRRRLREEMGLDCDLTVGPEFIYRAVDPQARGVEHEFDQILLGTVNGDPLPDPGEVAAWQWLEIGDLQRRMREQPDQFAPWFHLGLPLVPSQRR
ncbi:MAG TPA: isopentenyl-diphosphate Delta-isomerase [Gemmataceae bacterium]|nr:isopentenyl-diphosphate Delta-isomerase [Gemmataceae bacterium]